MDKLITTHNGDFPLELDDMRWQFEAYDKVFGAISRGIGPCVLTGCEVTGNDIDGWNIAPGYIIIEGEIREYLGQTGIALPGGPTAFEFVAQDDFDPTGDETFEDLTDHSCYQRRRAVIAPLDVGTPGTNVGNGARLGERLFRIIPSQVEAWRNVGTAGNPPFGFGYSGGTGAGRVRFRMESDGNVRLAGLLNLSGVGGNELAFQLPSTHAPSTPVNCSISTQDILPVGGPFVHVHIDTAGNVKLALPVPAITNLHLGSIPTFPTT